MALRQLFPGPVERLLLEVDFKGIELEMARFFMGWFLKRRKLVNTLDKCQLPLTVHELANQVAELPIFADAVEGSMSGRDGLRAAAAWIACFLERVPATALVYGTEETDFGREVSVVDGPLSLVTLAQEIRRLFGVIGPEEPSIFDELFAGDPAAHTVRFHATVRCKVAAAYFLPEADREAYLRGVAIWARDTAKASNWPFNKEDYGLGDITYAEPSPVVAPPPDPDDPNGKFPPAAPPHRSPSDDGYFMGSGDD